MTLSRSSLASRPARCRLPTISRIACSLPVACKSTMIDSRTTKSNNFIRPSNDGPPLAMPYARRPVYDALRDRVNATATSVDQPA